jgi:GTPase-activator protein for Ras-like GTPase
VYRELKRSTTEETLFRDDSMVTKSCRNYFQLVGLDYVKEIILPHILAIIESPDSCEVDPVRLETGGNSNGDNSDNLRRLRLASQGIVDSVFGAVDRIPYNIRKFFDLALQLVRQVFPQADSVVMTNFFWLRWICPLIISPDGFKLVDNTELPGRARRNLILVAKLIQNLANGVEFREPFLEPINDFVMGPNRVRLMAFMQQLSVTPSETESYASVPGDAERPPMDESEVGLALSVVVNQMHKNLSRVQSDIPKDPRVKAGESYDAAIANFRKVKDMLAADV